MLKANRVERRLSLQLTYPQSNRFDGRRATLRVTDEASSLVLLEAELVGDQVLDLIANATVYVDAEMLDSLDRIGKEMEHDQVGLGYADEDGRPWTSERVSVFAEGWRLDNQMDTVEYRRSNSGWIVVGRRWVELKDQEATG